MAAPVVYVGAGQVAAAVFMENELAERVASGEFIPLRAEPARQGHRLIFATSFGYLEPALRVADQFLRTSGGRLGHQRLKADQPAPRVIGVDRCDSARVAGVPRFQKGERGTIADLADDDAIRALYDAITDRINRASPLPVAVLDPRRDHIRVLDKPTGPDQHSEP